jgi:hypothetical protein
MKYLVTVIDPLKEDPQACHGVLRQESAPG